LEGSLTLLHLGDDALSASVANVEYTRPKCLANSQVFTSLTSQEVLSVLRSRRYLNRAHEERVLVRFPRFGVQFTTKLASSRQGDFRRALESAVCMLTPDTFDDLVVGVHLTRPNGLFPIGTSNHSIRSL